MAEVEIIKIEVDKENAAKKLVEVRRVLAEATKTRNELNKRIKEGATLTREETTALANAEKQISKNRAEQRQLVKQISSENSSLQQLRNELAKATRERNEQSTATEEGRIKFAQITKQIKEYSDSIKEAEEAGDDFRRSVGNYEKALNGLRSVNGKLKDSFKAVGTALKAVPFLLVAKLIEKFISLIAQNADVAELLEDALAGLNNVIGVLIENVVEIGKLFIEVVRGQKSFSEAITEGTERITGLGNALKGAALEGVKASQALRQVEVESAKLAIQTNKTQRAIEEQLTALANQGAPLEERLKSAQEASRLITEQINKEIDLEKQRLLATQLANNATKNKIEDDIKELEIQARIEELEAQKVARQKEVLGQASGIEKQVRAEQLKTVNDARKAELELSNFRAEKFAEDTARAEERAEKLIEIERNRLEIALQDEALLSAQRILLEEQTAQRIAEINEELANTRKEQIASLEEFIMGTRESSIEGFREAEAERQRIADESFTKQIENNIRIEQLRIEETNKRREEAETRKKIADLQAEQEVNAVATVVSTASNLLDEGTIAFKIAKSTEAVISTFTAITKTLAEPSLPFPSNIITAGLIGAQGFANVAQINAAAGGGEFITTKPTLLLVGDNPTGTERVTVEPINSMGVTSVSPSSGLVAMAGGGSIVSMGSERSAIQSQAITSGIDVAELTQAMKQMNLVVSVKEIAKTEERVTAKENISKI